MQQDTIEYFRCPISGHRLRLQSVSKQDGNQIIDGTLETSCGRYKYRISNGVPDFVDTLVKTADADSTLDLFGAEWQHFRNWGWLETYPDAADSHLTQFVGLAESTRAAFRNKAPFNESDLGPDKMVLDAGCGNGRFSAMAAATGATVIAVDAGDSAYVAYENLQGLENVTVLKADALNPPFPDDFFDAAYSIGVMQHTGIGPKLLKTLSRIVKPGKPFTVNCYGTGRPSYEFIGRLIRSVVTRISRDNQMKFAQFMAWTDRQFRKSERIGSWLRRSAFHRINILPTTHHMFHWYAPKIAEHYSPDQLNEWVANAGTTITKAKPTFHFAEYDDRERRRHHGAFQFRATVD